MENDAVQETSVLPRAAPQQQELLIQGVSVTFPYKPYAVQLQYMNAVMAAIQSNQNALLESPTGTGKSLCLLCATVGWLMQEKGGVSALPNQKRAQIVYTSRTHAQLSQVMREFKKTVYASQVTAAMLASREHLCVHKDVLKLPSHQVQNSACNMLRADKACRYAHGVHGFIAKEYREQQMGEGAGVGLHDIEELASIGRKQCFCPYYYERELSADADIIFLPYTYIVDPTLAQQLPFQLSKAILIIDEAHNIPNFVSTAASIDVNATDMSRCIFEVTRAIGAAKIPLGNPEEVTNEMEIQCQQDEQDFSVLKLLLCNIEKDINGEKLTRHGNELYLVHGGDYMLEFLARHDITKQSFVQVVDVITRAVTTLARTDSPSRALPKLLQFFQLIFASQHDVEILKQSFRFVLRQEDRDGAVNSTSISEMGRNESQRRSLGFWCLDTQIALRAALTDVRCMILTSGTLTPIDHFAAELGIPFPIQLQGDHVIGRDQLFSSVLQNGPMKGALNSCYNSRDKKDYKEALGMSIVNIARVVREGGILIFFPSYALMHGVTEYWKQCTPGSNRTIWAMLFALKQVFVEPRDNSELRMTVAQFKAAAETHGAILMAVCRGRVSEGVDFADCHGRCVIVTGIPYANHGDLLVKLKRQFLTDISPKRPKVNNKFFTGDDWYKNEAMRTVNQCIGRVIRHKDDFGAIILADERFAPAQTRSMLSPWVRGVTNTCDTFSQLYQPLAKWCARMFRVIMPIEAHRPQQQQIDEGDGKENPTINEGKIEELSSATTTTSAAAAHEYALFQKHKNEEKERQDARDGVLVVNQGPVNPQSLQSNVMSIPTMFNQQDVAAAVPLVQSAVFMKQEKNPTRNSDQPKNLETRSTAGATTTTMEEPVTSRQFCENLKNILEEKKYQQFKLILAAIGNLRKISNVETKNKMFEGEVVKLKLLFSPLEDSERWLVDFGCWIPEALRQQYARLIRKRKRDHP